MSSKIPTIERLVNLALFFDAAKRAVTSEDVQRQTAIGYPPNQSEESFKRQFLRDRTALQKMGIYIESTPEGRYQLNANRSFAHKITLEPHEVATLKLIGEAVVQDQDFPFKQDLKVALLKLDQLRAQHDTAKTHEANGVTTAGKADTGHARYWADNHVARVPTDRAMHNDQGSLEHSLALITETLSERKTLLFEYTSPHVAESESTTKREVLGIKTFMESGYHYFVGHDFTRNGNLRNFRVDRMRQLKLGTQRKLPVPTQADIAREAQSAVRRYPFQFASSEHEATPVTLLIQLKDGSTTTWETTCTDKQELFKWICAQEELITIVEPQAYREAFIKALDAACEKIGHLSSELADKLTEQLDATALCEKAATEAKGTAESAEAAEPVEIMALEGAAAPEKKRGRPQDRGSTGSLGLTTEQQRAQRALALIGILRETSEGLELASVAQALGVSIEQARADVDALSCCGIDEFMCMPLYTDELNGRSVVVMWNELPALKTTLRLSPAETQALITACDRAHIHTDNPVLAKLITTLGAEQPIEKTWPDDVDQNIAEHKSAEQEVVKQPDLTSDFAALLERKDAQALTIIAQALTDDALLELVYHKPAIDNQIFTEMSNAKVHTHADSRTSTPAGPQPPARLVKPLQLKHNAGHWYLWVWSFEADDLRTLRVDRIARLAIASQSVQNAHPLNDHAKQLITTTVWQIEPAPTSFDQPQIAQIAVLSTWHPRVRDWFGLRWYQPEQELSARTTKDAARDCKPLFAELPLSGSAWLALQIAGELGDVIPLAPNQLTQMTLDRLSNISALQQLV